MSREKIVVILKLVVKHFFIKKEVTSSLVMEFLFHGLNSLVWSTNKEKILQTDSRQMVKLDLDSSILKALEEEPKKERATDVKNLTAPIVSVDKDMFVLVDDQCYSWRKMFLSHCLMKGVHKTVWRLVSHCLYGSIFDYNFFFS